MAGRNYGGHGAGLQEEQRLVFEGPFDVNRHAILVFNLEGKICNGTNNLILRFLSLKACGDSTYFNVSSI